MPLTIKTGAVKVKDESTGNYVDIDMSLGVDYAPLNSPDFAGTPTAPTPTSSDNSTKIATTAFVQGKVGDLNSAINAITPFTTVPTSGSTKGITSGAVYTALSNRIGILIASDYYDPTFSHTYSVTTGIFLLTVIGYGPVGGATTAKGQYIITCGAQGNVSAHPLIADTKFTITGNNNFTVTVATATARYTGVVIASMTN